MNMLSFDIGEFVYKYYIHPIVYAGEGYNPVNTVTYAIILGISLFAILKVMDMLKVRIDEKFVVSTVPFIIVGASLRVVQDVQLVQPPLSYMFITPFVYVLAFVITAAVLLICLGLQRAGVVKDYSKPYFWTGVAGIVIVLGMLFTQEVRLWWAPVLIVLLAATFTASIYVIARHLKLDFLTNKLNIAILAAHMFDASSTFTAIDLVGGWYEEHVVPVFFIDLFGTSFVMYALKLAVFIPVIYIIEKYFKDDPQMYYGIKFVLLVLGAGPGIRNTLHMTFVSA
ncbi:conserved hypothetical protein [Methanocella arvoryzae MRE50]|uniref:DUF63 family protein n=2 Tax=Methanocella TaxID=570266 RepID=Q0W4M9_METAR|nr:conserved hypothetical protein [Methanocella arvoryzae MRE50]